MQGLEDGRARQLRHSEPRRLGHELIQRSGGRATLQEGQGMELMGSRRAVYYLERVEKILDLGQLMMHI